MKILTIVKYRLLQSLRDVQSLITMILIPIFLILILGNALKNNEDFTARTVDKVNLLYVNNSSSQGASAFDNFINLDGLKDIINVEKTSDINEGKKLIENRKYDALVIYDESSVNKLELIGSEYNQLGVSIVKGIVDSYASSANSMEALSKIQSKNYTIDKNTNLQEESITVSGKKPSATVINGILYFLKLLLTLVNSSKSISKISKTYIAISVLFKISKVLLVLISPKSLSSLNPAVSINNTGPTGINSIAFCTGSVVVPSFSETKDTSCPNNLLIKEDLPALVLP